MTGKVETHEFQAESRQLLQLVVHSVYSNKDIFLRELISNASDALDKLRLESLRDGDLGADTSDLHITLETDREARTLTVRDNGIGMSRDEVTSLIGTIAKSGTAEFARKLKEANENKDAAASADLIGSFGVGFYSSFMVADKVTLVTRRAGEREGTRWESAGEGTYELETLDDAPQGTSVTLHLKPEDAEDHLYDYTDTNRLRQIVRKHSDFIPWPVRTTVERPAAASDSESGETTPDTPDTPDEVVETLNSMKALWARSPDDISEEEYKEFYKHVSHDWTDPLETVHTRAEGTFEYQAVLFIPSHAPLDLYQQGGGRRGVHLYVRRVFIMDDCTSLLPDYLRFVKGVVDAQDLSLNVSREALQQDRQIQLMHRRLVKKILSTVKSLRTKDAERYRTFWQEFGPAMKEGLLSDYDNRETLLDLASFPSTHDPKEQTSLRDYVSRMKEGQEHIYFLTGESRTRLENSPHIEAFQAKGYEVLLLTDPVDEVWVEQIREFDGTPLQSIAKGQVDLDADKTEKERSEEDEQQTQEFEPLLTWLGTALSEDVKEVRLSSRLTTSPACIVGDANDVTPNLEKMYRAMGQDLPRIKRILELNPNHELVTSLRDAYTANQEDPALTETAELLYGMALLAEGGDLTDPARFTRLLATRLAAGL